MTTERNDDPRLSVEQIENMTPHQLAQLLSNLVQVLQRMPNEPLKNLKRNEQLLNPEDLADVGRHQKTQPGISDDLPDWLS